MKTVSIVENSDFKRAYYRENGRSYNRLGITTSKKIGNAVKRNRSRRVLRAAFLNLENNIKQGYDIILVARGKTPYAKSFEVKEELNKLFVKASLIKDDI